MNSQDFVNDVVRMSRRVIDEHADTLASLGRNADVPQANASGNGTEIVFYIRHDGDIDDAVEFMAVKHGVPVCPLPELERWLRSTMSDVIKRAVEGA